MRQPNRDESPGVTIERLDGASEFVECPPEIAAVIADIPGRELRAAYEGLWGRLKAPAITIAELRQEFYAHYALEASRTLKRSEQFVTLLEAARILGVSPKTIRRQVERGELEYERTNRGWLMVKVDVPHQEQVPTRAQLLARLPERLRPDPRLNPT